MSEFRRSLPGNGAIELRRLSSNRIGWWPDLLAAWSPSGSFGGLRVAIRKNTINFYSKGQSIARISFGQGGKYPTMSIHEKYVMKSPSEKQKYIKLKEDEGSDKDGRPVAWGGSNMLQHWTSNSKCYRTKEKRCIDTLVGHSPKVIDLEMGLPAFENRTSSLRMDLVTLEVISEGIRLVFWEGKMINDGRLRSSIGDPEVFQQIDGYRSYLADPSRKRVVADAYVNCCKIICSLHKMAECVGLTGPIDPLIEAAARANSLEVEETPRLVIFENYKNRRESAWQKHLTVLRSKVSVAIVDNQSKTMPLELIPRRGG